MPAPAPHRPPLGLRGSTTMDAAGAWSRIGLSSVTAALVSEPAGESDGGSVSHGFTVGDVLGSGGTAVVRAALQHTLDRPVAMKQLHAAIENHNSRELLLREARVTGLLEHPNIVPIHDLLIDESGHPRIVMQRIAGHTWTEMMEDDALVAGVAGDDVDPLEWHLRVLAQVCNAIHFAHSRGIVHRDLKPDNVMIGRFGEVYVMDWGLAVTTRQDGPRGVPGVDQRGRFAGTPAYMAPEMLGDALLSERTDVFLLGALLYAIVTKRAPYDGPVDDAMFAQIREALPPLDAPGDSPVPPELVALIRRSMARLASDRPATADELRLSVERYLRHRGAEPLIAASLAQLHRLEHQLTGTPDRLALYTLQAQCLFGFEEALRIDPSRTDARRGRHDAALAMARYEVDRGDPDAAVVMLSAMDPAPQDLVDRIADLRAAHDAEQQRLVKLQLDRDLNVGRRLRLSVFGAFAVLWTLLPLAGPTVERELFGGPSYTLQLGLDTFFLASFGLTTLLLRRALLTTDFNRWLAGAVSLVLGAQVMLDLGTQAMGIPPLAGHSLHLFLWFVGASFAAMVIERTLAIAAVGYLLAWGASIAWPGALYPLITLSSALILALTVWAWGRPVRLSAPSGPRSR